MIDPANLRPGMVVRSDEGEELGKIHSFGIASFVVGKGLFFHDDSLLGYEDVQEIRNGEVILRHDTETLRGLSLLEGEEALAEVRRHLHEPRTIDSVVSDEEFDPQPGAVHIGAKGKE